MSHTLDRAIKASAGRLSEYIETHRNFPKVTLSGHIRQMRRERAARASAKRLIYLDTNAWKCMADYRQQKASLTPPMNAFGASLEQAAKTGAFAFPIGLPTFFELDSMTSPTTRDTLVQLVDELSLGFCIAPFPDRVGTELRQLRSGVFQTTEGLEDFLCSPIELLGIPAVSLPGFDKAHVDEETFNKAFFDTLTELPFSIQLKVASSAPGEKWDNSRGIDDLNAGKAEHQAEIKNLNTGIFVELKGCIERWFVEEGVILSPREISLYALNALHHWHQTPTSRAFPTLRVLSSLYGLMRFDAQRRYRGGDPNDFMVAASALPVAHALFTDRKLAVLLSDPRIGLRNFSDCTVVSGFEDMAKYIADQL
jgi:hypothetical protein